MKYSEVVVHHKQSPLSAYVDTNMAENSEKEDMNKLHPIQLPKATSKKNADCWMSTQCGTVTAQLKAIPTYKDKSGQLWDAEKTTQQAKLVKHEETRAKEYEKVKTFTTSHAAHSAAKMLLQFQACKFRCLIIPFMSY